MRQYEKVSRPNGNTRTIHRDTTYFLIIIGLIMPHVFETDWRAREGTERFVKQGLAAIIATRTVPEVAKTLQNPLTVCF